jgi:hypothetical protein
MVVSEKNSNKKQLNNTNKLMIFVKKKRSLGLQTNLFSAQTTNRVIEKTSLAEFCSSLTGLTAGQAKLCELYTDHVSAIAKGARIGIVECQHQFKQTQWNCSTVSNQTVFGPSISNIGKHS